MQHSEVPHQIDNIKESSYDENNPERILEHGDKVIYAAIRLYMNVESRTCYPSTDLIKKKSGCGYAKVTAAIKRLIQAGLIELRKIKLPNGKWSNLYYFPETEFDKHFEMFSSDFFDLDLPINIKEYYMDVQKYMYDKESGIGKIGYSNTKLAELTGWSPQTIKKFNTYLTERNLLNEIPTGKYDEAGFPVMKKEFNLTSFQQAALWVKAVTEQLTTNTQQINAQGEDIEDIKLQLHEANLRIKELERRVSVQKYPESYEF